MNAAFYLKSLLLATLMMGVVYAAGPLRACERTIQKTIEIKREFPEVKAETIPPVQATGVQTKPEISGMTQSAPQVSLPKEREPVGASEAVPPVQEISVNPQGTLAKAPTSAPSGATQKTTSTHGKSAESTAASSSGESEQPDATSTQTGTQTAPTGASKTKGGGKSAGSTQSDEEGTPAASKPEKAGVEGPQSKAGQKKGGRPATKESRGPRASGEAAEKSEQGQGTQKKKPPAAPSKEAKATKGGKEPEKEAVKVPPAAEVKKPAVATAPAAPWEPEAFALRTGSIPTVEQYNIEADKAFINWKIQDPYSGLSPTVKNIFTEPAIQFIVGAAQMPLATELSPGELDAKIRRVTDEFKTNFDPDNLINRTELYPILRDIIKPEYVFQITPHPLIEQDKIYNEFLRTLEEHITPADTTLKDWALRFLTSESLYVALPIIDAIDVDGKSFSQLTPDEKKKALQPAIDIVTERFLRNFQPVQQKFQIALPGRIDEAIKYKVSKFLREKFVSSLE